MSHGKSISPLILALVIIFSIFNVECSNSRRASLQIKLRTQVSSRDLLYPSPVTFHLLDVDPFHLVMSGEHENTPQGSEVYRTHPRLKILAGKLNARRFGGYSLSSDVFLFIDQSRPLWELHVLRSGQTDSSGASSIDNLTPGSYWLLAYSRVPDGESFWVQQVDINAGANEVELQRANALYVSSTEQTHSGTQPRTRYRRN
jgi:hypothetical protein